jgi:ferredoxin-NADP reductase
MATQDLRKIRSATLTEIRDYTTQIRELFLKTEESFEFRSGQFVMLHVPQPGAAKPALRAYSIASTDKRTDGFRLVFKAVQNGLASRYVWKLKEGETVRFTGPFGRVFFREPPTEQVIFLNTGSGISQHFSYLESFVERYPKLNAHLVFGLRHETDAYYLNELGALAKRLPGLSYQYAFSRPMQSIAELNRAGIPCFKGYVQDALEPLQPVAKPTTVYLCGNGAMIKSTKAKLESMGFDLNQVVEEAFD